MINHSLFQIKRIFQSYDLIGYKTRAELFPRTTVRVKSGPTVHEKMKQVYLLRHGESEAQVHSRVTSEYSRTRDPALKDCALTRRGVDQAKRAGSSLVEYLDTSIDGEPLDLIVVSPLTRALQTALLMCKGARGELDDVPIIVLPAIAEAGNIMENHRRTADELRCDRKLTMFPRFESFDFSLLDAADRAIAAFGSSYSPHDEKGAKTRAVRHYLGACGARNIAVIGHYCRFIELVQPHVHVTHFTNCKIVTCRCCPICGMLFPRTNRDGSVGDETHVCQRAPAVGSSSPSASSGSGSGGSGTSTTSTSGSRPPTVQRQLSDDATALFSAALSGMTPADRNLLMRVRSERDVHEKAIQGIGNGVRGKKAKKARMRHAQRVATLKRTPRYAAALAAAKAAGAPQPPAAAAAAAVRSSLSELTCGTASRSGLVLHLESSDAASAAAAWRAPVAALQAHLPDGGAISPLHITLLGASVVKSFGRDRLRAALSAAPAAGLPAPPRLKFDGVARVARRGGRRTAFLRLASQDKWSTYVDRLLSALRECSADGEESSSVSDGEARLFHVSCWNNDHGGSYQSVGNIDRSDDSRGVNFIQLFGALKFNSASSGGILRNGEVGSEDEDSAAADAVAAAAAAEAPEAMVLTREELRRGNTCRRPAPGSSAECQAKFPRTFHIHDLGGMTGDDLLLDDSEKARFLNGVNIVTVEEKIDGANLGVSLSPDMRGASGRPAFRFQKRAHYITSASEPQYVVVL